MCTPSQSKHASSNFQFQKTQLKMFLEQLNFPNPMRTPGPFTIKAFTLESFGIYCFRCWFSLSSHLQPLEMVITGSSNNPGSQHEWTFPFCSHFGSSLPSFGQLSFFFAGPTVFPISTLRHHLEFAPFQLFSMSWPLFSFSKLLVSWGFLYYPYIFFPFHCLSFWFLKAPPHKGWPSRR